jgi:Flp pilus assembly protein TadB
MSDLGLMLVSSVALGLALGLGWGYLFSGLCWFGGQPHPKLREEMEAVGMDTSSLPSILLFWRTLGLVSLLVLGGIYDMPPVGIFAAIMCYRGGPIWVRRSIQQHVRRVNEQMVGATRNLAGQLRVGLPQEAAVNTVSRITPAPLGDHLRITAAQLVRGMPFTDSMTDLKRRVRLESISAFAVAMIVSSRRGGKLSLVLERIADAIDRFVQVERKRETNTASGRLMINVMSIFPFLFLGFFYTLDPELISLVFTTTPGQITLCVVGSLIFVSIRWASRILGRVGTK